jgi:hypothetical protein
MKKAFLVMALILVSTIAYQIVGDSVVYENAYGKITVWPHTSQELIHQCQYVNITSKLPSQNLDFALSTNDWIENLKVYVWESVNNPYEACNSCQVQVHGYRRLSCSTFSTGY